MKYSDLVLPLTRLSNGANGSFHHLVLTIMSETDVQRLGLTSTWLARYAATIRQLDENFVYHRKSDYTDDMHTADERRSGAYRVIVGLLRTGRLLPTLTDGLDESQRFALDDIVSRFPLSLIHASQPVRDTHMEGLAIRLRKDCPDVVERLHLGPMLEVLDQASYDVGQLYLARNRETMQKTGRIYGHARSSADALYEALVYALCARITLPAATPDEAAVRAEALRLAGLIAAIVSDYRTSYKKHLTWLRKRRNGEVDLEPEDAEPEDAELEPLEPEGA